jgi:hypothetical protein
MEDKKEGIDEEERIKALEMSKISLIIDTYDDIFSDFDPRPFSERALSDDFLLEAKKASYDKQDEIELRFLVPASQRKLGEERLIKKRLREHFRKHHTTLHKEARNIIRWGIFFVVLGIILMFSAAFVLWKYSDKGLLTSFMVILLEPAGWFFFWEGMGQVVFEAKKKRSDLVFYEKMSRCTITFFSV